MKRMMCIILWLWGCIMRVGEVWFFYRVLGGFGRWVVIEFLAFIYLGAHAVGYMSLREYTMNE